MKRVKFKFICSGFVVSVMVLSFLYGCHNVKNPDDSTNNIESTQSQLESGSKDIKQEKENYIMEIKYKEDGKFDFSVTPKQQVYSDDKYYQPFKNIFGNDIISGTVDPKRPYRNVATIEYTKREGGTYIYSNNPEMLAQEDVGQALIRNYDMQGDYMFTFEHSNHTGKEFYLGYQLLNTGNTDAVVTVYNIGYQVAGEWLGQKSWSDYFNYKFTLPDDYFQKDGQVNPIYVGCDYIDYTPRVFEGVKVTVPAGKYIYVIGGTTADAYNNTDIASTADLPVLNGKCSNGAVKFRIESGKMQGSFYCYTDASQVQANPEEQGYIVSRNGKNYGAQYKGTDYTQGLIESNVVFVVNDMTDNGKLSVKYNREIDPNYASKNTPFAEYKMQKDTVSGKNWLTSLNPNTSPSIGTDMMVFEYIDSEGNPIIIDNKHADGTGSPANTGNWMVQYTDNFSLVNVGEKERVFRIYKKGSTSGALFTMVRNDKGEIIDARMKANPYSFPSLDSVFYGVDKSLLVQKNGAYWFKVADGRPYCDVVDERALVYEIKVAPKSCERISVDYLILGNSCGGINHWVEVDDAE